MNIRFFARSKFSKILVHEKKFNAIWEEAFRSEYLGGVGYTSFEFEWTLVYIFALFAL